MESIGDANGNLDTYKQQVRFALSILCVDWGICSGDVTKLTW